MLRGNDSPVSIPFNPGWVKPDTLLYQYLTKTTTIPNKINEDGSISIDTPAASLQILRKYLATGDVSADPTEVQTLVEQLSYWNIYQLKVEYPAEFLIIKLKEEWYRNNLYNPVFATASLQEPYYDLIQLSPAVMNEFPLIPNLHYLFPNNIRMIGINEGRDLVQKEVWIIPRMLKL